MDDQRDFDGQDSWPGTNSPVDNDIMQGSNSVGVNPRDLYLNDPDSSIEPSCDLQIDDHLQFQGLSREIHLPNQETYLPNQETYLPNQETISLSDSNDHRKLTFSENPSLGEVPLDLGSLYPVPDASTVDYTREYFYQDPLQYSAVHPAGRNNAGSNSVDRGKSRAIDLCIPQTPANCWPPTGSGFVDESIPTSGTSPTFHSSPDSYQHNLTPHTEATSATSSYPVDKGKNRAIEWDTSPLTSWYQADQTRIDQLLLQNGEIMASSSILALFMWNRIQKRELRYEPVEEEYQTLAGIFPYSVEQFKQSFEENFRSSYIHDSAGVETQDQELNRQSQNKAGGKRKRTANSRKSTDMSISTRSGHESMDLRQTEGYEIRNKRAVDIYKKKQGLKDCRVNGMSKYEEPKLLPCLVCETCDASFTKDNKASWLKHNQRIDSDNYWVCPYCKEEDGVFVSVRRNRMKNHIETDHKTKANEIKNKEGNINKNWNETLESKQVAVKGDREKWRCHFCHKTFSSRRDFGKHVVDELEKNDYKKDDWFRKRREWSEKKKQQHSKRNGERHCHTTYDLDPKASNAGDSESDSDTGTGCNSDLNLGSTSGSDSDSDSEGPSSGSKRPSGSRGAKRENTRRNRSTKKARKDNGEGPSRTTGITEACEVEKLSDDFACNLNIDATVQNHHGLSSMEKAKTSIERLCPQELSSALAGISGWIDEDKLELHSLGLSFFDEVEFVIDSEDTLNVASLDNLPGSADTDTLSENSGQLSVHSVHSAAADSKLTECCSKLVHVCKERGCKGKQIYRKHHNGQRTGGQAACSMDVIRISLVISSDKKLLSIFKMHRQHSVLDSSSMFPIPQRFFIRIFARSRLCAEQQILKPQERFSLAGELTEDMSMQKKQECNAAVTRPTPLYDSFESTIRFSNPLTMLKAHLDRIPTAQGLIHERWISGLKVFSPNFYGFSNQLSS